MGQEKKPGELFWRYDKDDLLCRVTDLKTVDLDADGTEDAGEMRYLNRPRGLSISFRPKFPRLTRRRFVRNLMKLGYSKKQAKKIAEDVKANDITYGYANFYYTIRGFCG